ncbi:MAG: dihydrolipoyllysine-residue acetyltransferase [Pseudomonadales bacterium]|jgi:pyruvate dehydrogenase E2 component (dihydrolipoamide acetyltransferase)|nr:dihydrolipoyllysine-residue acetyltransferase [Pseudomonadales bacterium]
MIEKVLVPDVGEAEDVEVVEILVTVGDMVAADDSLVVLESDKASMEIPSPYAGKITGIETKEGDQVGEGSLLLEIETESKTEATVEPEPEPGSRSEPEPTPEPETEADTAETTTRIETSKVITVPDVGDAQEIVVAEVLTPQGTQVDEGESVVVLESDKASMEIPSDLAGVVQEVFVGEGDEVKEGDPLVTVVGRVAPDQVNEPVVEKTPVPEDPEYNHEERPADVSRLAPLPQQQDPAITPGGKVHAGPAVRKQAREYGVDLGDVKGSGRRGRVLKEDIQEYVKSRLSRSSDSGGLGIPEVPEVDFTKWGEVEEKPLSRIRKASARNLHRSWLNVPHVTQFDEADITDLELFRKSRNEQLQKEGVKLTPLAFLIKAVVDALIRFPQFNASITKDYDHLILKKYYHIGIAVETEDGLVVPVLKDADSKGVVQLANESAELAAQARDKKLPMDAMQGATFTISSLGGIGGTAFTPIVNTPEVAILGVSRSKVSPVWNGSEFTPRTMLPLSLSYDHRAIDGAEAARFTTYLASVLTDMRKVLM